MTKYTLVIGNKNYSSWSLRAWLAVKRSGAEFEEVVIPLFRPGSRDMISTRSPSGKVPVLQGETETVWDSLAIGEYLAERFPEAGLWPADASARAIARSVCAEMHSGFAPLRKGMPMNVRANAPGKGHSAEVDADIARVQEIWQFCRARFGGDDPFLFGAWSLADAFYAPIVSRFRTYGVALSSTCQAYADAVWELPEMQEWAAAAAAEPYLLPEYEL